MGEISLSDALEKVRSSRAKDRSDGLADLKHVLIHNKRSSKFEVLNDKGYHKLLESLFSLAQIEKRNLVNLPNSSKSSTRAQTASRLSACAAVLRIAVEVGVQSFRYKTVKALVQHITQTLPDAEGVFCEPIVGDYLKSLRVTLEFRPHPEHFSKEEWLNAVDFCIDGIRTYSAIGAESDANGSNGSSAHGSSYYPATRGVTPVVSAVLSGGLNSRNPAHIAAKTTLEEVMFSLYNLLSTTNAPVLERTSSISVVLLDFFRSSGSAGRAHQVAFMSLNILLVHSSTEDVTLTQQILKEITPLIRRFWHSRSTALKDEMLVSLVNGTLFLPTLVAIGDAEDFRDDLQALVDAMQADYSKRADREQLQLDDLELIDPASNVRIPERLGTKGFDLKSVALKAEFSFALVQTIATISVLLQEHANFQFEKALIYEDNVSRKRQRTAKPINDLLTYDRTLSVSTRVCSLQILTFSLDRLTLDLATTREVLDCLVACLSEDNGLINSWAMLALSSVIRQSFVSTLVDQTIWLQICQLAGRCLTSEMACRASCHFFSTALVHEVIRWHDISDLVNVMLSSVDLNGPIALVDSSAAFWSILVSLKSRHSPGQIHNTSESVLRWMMTRWAPSNFRSRNKVSQSLMSRQANVVMKLISAILGLPFEYSNCEQYRETGLFSLAYLRCCRNEKLIRFLLLDEKAFSQQAVLNLARDLGITPLSDIISRSICRSLSDFLCSELKALLQADIPQQSDGPQGISAVYIQSVSIACLITYSLLSAARLRPALATTQLANAAAELRAHMIQYIAKQEDPRYLVGILLESFAVFIEPASRRSAKQNILSLGASAMAEGFQQDFWRQGLYCEDATFKNDALMDEDEVFESQGNYLRKLASVGSMPHDALAASSHAFAIRSSLIVKICLISNLVEVSDEGESDNDIVSPSFFYYLTSLPKHEFLACRLFFNELFCSTFRFDVRGVVSLLEYMGQTLLQPYNLERSEVSLGVCLDIMTGLADIWTNVDLTDASDLGSSLYEWFINIALGHGKSSPHVLVCLSHMLQRVIKIRPEYAREFSLPSARTSLFRILEEGSIVVKYAVGAHISEIFGLFVLKEHESILEDIIGSLPTERDWFEGIAIRLLTLSKLASSWSTLLRRCIYAIFETSGHVVESTNHANYCMSHVANKLQLRNPRELFNLFVSQIMYTWLETQSIKCLPYSVFGYKNLTEMLADIQDEVVGQVVMRGKDDEASQLVHYLAKSYETLLGQSFARAVAYSIARDAAVRPTKDAQKLGAESSLRKRLGKDRYGILITQNFPRVLATFYQIVDKENHIINGFQKRSIYATAQQNYDEILESGSSTAILPPNQQPSFKAGYLIDMIEFLCHRTNNKLETFWTPALYVYVFQELSDTIHEALGPLHTCSVIRKLRILVCMAGDTALTDYPLEMALHILRPYLSDTHCTEDVIGIFKYLLGHGSLYLQQVPSTTASIGISTLVSMKAFLNSPQESTTQESQFRVTMSKAESFHTWVGKYLASYNSTNLADTEEQSFKAILESARRIRMNGTARQGTYESDLLLHLLEDQLLAQPMIDQSSHELIFDLICIDFDMPDNCRDDILGSDEVAAKYAHVIWKQCQRTKSGGFLLWASKIIGRAYLGAGFIDKDMLNEVRHESLSSPDDSRPDSAMSQSMYNILRRLSRSLRSNLSREVSIAQQTLQLIVSHSEESNFLTQCERTFSASLLKALLWQPYMCPMTRSKSPNPGCRLETALLDLNMSFPAWVRRLCVALVSSTANNPVLLQLRPILELVVGIAEQLLPYVLHLVLLQEASRQQNTKPLVSQAFQRACENVSQDTVPHVRLLLHCLLYLHTQPFPLETNKSDRSQWLEVDYQIAAKAAASCEMFKTALLFLEISFSESAKKSRRSSEHQYVIPLDMLLSIFQNLDEKDSFYGIEQPANLASITDRLEYENAGFKSLSFRAANYDGQIRLSQVADQEAQERMIGVLETLDLNGLSQSLLRNMLDAGPKSNETMLRSARKLERWDISTPAATTSSGAIFRVLQTIQSATNVLTIRGSLEGGLMTAMEALQLESRSGPAVHSSISCLAVLTEIDEVVSCREPEQLGDAWSRLESRNKRMAVERFEHVNQIASCRETIFGILSKSAMLQSILRVGQRDARKFESRAVLASSNFSRGHGALQTTLATATYLSQLVEPCEEVGVYIKAAASFEAANVLWDQNEMAASVSMLRDLNRQKNLPSQDIHIGRPKLLAKLGHRISEARLEKPDQIIDQYLIPAIKELGQHLESDEAGQVFHEFASFCDRQLQNQDTLEDFRRIEKLREQKESEIQDLERMIKSSDSLGKDKDNLKSHRTKAKQWYELDNREYVRLREGRQAFLRQSLENYLLSLKACDVYDKDALRFAALWLEHFETETANLAVQMYIADVSSRKLAPLMNQWSSRLLDDDSKFQSLLASLVLRICTEHPYHGMYQVFASSKTKGGRDDAALSRNAAATNIVNQLKASKRASPTWLALHNSNINYVRFAVEKLDDMRHKPGSKVPLRKSQSGQKLEHDVINYHIPPPTMTIDLRADCDYKDVPVIVRFQPEFTIASGISMPKILTSIASDGRKYKQLFKGGNDDLRQDSIMEQVFEQVSSLLQMQRDTRQRRLGIRTYKVLPLTATSGIIEFVPNTIPLHDYLMPAHQRHFPNDLKPNVCRKHIADSQSKPVEVRVKTFRNVIDRFHPVLRYFFMERFENPDDWFDRRLAYVRSTAAISILGHVLGLGDRHGHNILVDEKSGEVVHIDLGIAFEQGRVLPVPEVVPFRLTRDIVDGMGITKTEGVFRRCCDFTLEALRNESYTIMTILDVLRYDPLYSWSLSPLRLKRLQEAQTEAPPPPTDADDGPIFSRKKENEAGEAARALMIVSKKLSKSLSVTATVNELIQQATDEKNLALLFCGWAAYA